MIRTGLRIILMMLGALALAGCSGSPDETQAPPSPLLFEIRSDSGEIEGWMLGTIHILPDGVEWRTDQLETVVSQADFLIVEIAGLEDRAAMATTFAELAASPDQPALAQRVSPELKPALNSVIARSRFSPDDFSATETWAAALMLAQTDITGKSENGVDRAIIRDFSDRPVEEFEGALGQLSIFDTLPERDQRDLLNGVLIELESAKEEPEKLRTAWLSGNEILLEQATRSGIMADPELYEALIVQRNARWTARLDDTLKDGPQPLVAVGAGHLVGRDSLVKMLSERGYTVRRIQ